MKAKYTYTFESTEELSENQVLISLDGDNLLFKLKDHTDIIINPETVKSSREKTLLQKIKTQLEAKEALNLGIGKAQLEAIIAAQNEKKGFEKTAMAMAREAEAAPAAIELSEDSKNALRELITQGFCTKNNR